MSHHFTKARTYSWERLTRLPKDSRLWSGTAGFNPERSDSGSCYWLLGNVAVFLTIPTPGQSLPADPQPLSEQGITNTWVHKTGLDSSSRRKLADVSSSASALFKQELVTFCLNTAASGLSVTVPLTHLRGVFSSGTPVTPDCFPPTPPSRHQLNCHSWLAWRQVGRKKSMASKEMRLLWQAALLLSVKLVWRLVRWAPRGPQELPSGW